MSSNFFDEPFDDETLLKLEIYKDYLNEWLPVFLVTEKPKTRRVNIFDFFSGAGTDSIGQKGSPLIALEAISTERYLSCISGKDLEVNFYFNDYDQGFISRLKQSVESLNCDASLNIHISCLDFKDCYSSLRPQMQNAANFVFLDQFGVECVTREIFVELISSPMTDILFFISSSHFNRFYWHDTFKNVLDISKEELTENDFFHIHNLVLRKYREFIPENQLYFLAPFSIKKSSTINGLIFGSRHLLGIEKFLKVGWSKDKKRGEANFDIDRERLEIGENSLFPEYYVPKKIEFFQNNLKEFVLKNNYLNEMDVFIFTLQNGCLGSHAKLPLKELKDAGKIFYEGQLALTYSSLKKRWNEFKPIKVL